MGVSGGAWRQGRFDRPWRAEGAEPLHAGDRGEGELRGDVVGDRRESQDAQFHRPARVPELLEVTAAEVPGSQRQRPARDRVVDRARPGLELPPDGRADEVGPIGVEPLVHEEVDLAEVDETDVDGDLLALVDLGHVTSLGSGTILSPSHGMVNREFVRSPDPCDTSAARRVAQATAGQPATPSTPMAVPGRHAATSTAASLGEFGQASGRAWTAAASRRATPLDLVERGARWWTSMADRRAPQWHLPHRTVLSTPFAHVHDFSSTVEATDVVPTL